MEWKTIAEYPDYEVSESGDVRKISTKNPVNQWKGYKDYLSVKIKNSAGKFLPVRIHVLVYDAFVRYHKNITGRIVHIDGRLINNHRSNLKLQKYKIQPDKSKNNRSSITEMEPLGNESSIDLTQSKTNQYLIFNEHGDILVDQEVFEHEELVSIIEKFIQYLINDDVCFEDDSNNFIIPKLMRSEKLDICFDTIFKLMSQQKIRKSDVVDLKNRIADYYKNE